MNTLISFREVKIGDYFYLVEGGEIYDYKKLSESEASIMVTDILGTYEAITEFSPNYEVGYYPPSQDDSPEFPIILL